MILHITTSRNDQGELGVRLFVYIQEFLCGDRIQLLPCPIIRQAPQRIARFGYQEAVHIYPQRRMTDGSAD